MTNHTVVSVKARTGKSSANGTTSPIKVSDTTIHRLTDVFKLLADKSRLKILLALAQDGELHVSALCDMLDQSQPAVSHHLSLMRHTKLVRCDRQGKHNFYRLDPARFGEMIEQLFGEMGNGAKQILFEDFALSIKRK